MAKIGFGAYRITHQSDEHKKALKLALDSEVSLIDTSSNYTDGESEELIGRLLKNSKHKPMLVSKVGYIQGKNLEIIEKLSKTNQCQTDLVVINEQLKHSIHPDFIEDQIHRSLERLQQSSLDYYLLHNPEYYLKTDKSTKEEYYRRIKLAFEKMEELVERGLIKFYGVSSNTLVDPREDHTSTDLDLLMGAARSVRKDHHFRMIQFPLNILEMGALERQYDGEHLIEHAHTFGLKTLINRPLNCFSEHGLLRLATYPVDKIYTDEKNAATIFNQCISPLVVKWFEVREDESDKLFDIPLMQQVEKLWHKQNSKDAVDQIFRAHFFPLVANIWGKDLTTEESQSFYELYEHGIEFAKHNMNQRAREFEKQAIQSGLLFESDLTLTQKVIEKYQSFGVDYILMGMRRAEYVEGVKSYF